MANLKKVIEQILKMPYEINSTGCSKHEELVQVYLEIEGGFKQISVDLFRERGLYAGEYVYQPYGSQRHPDFIVRQGIECFDIECKTNNKAAFPVYNGGMPKEKTIYIFSSGKYDETTVFLGQDVLLEKKRELYEDMIQELNEVLESYQAKPEWHDDERGFDFYIRNMFTQKGGSEKVDYFLHKDRQRCEQRVLDYVSRDCSTARSIKHVLWV